MSAEQNALKSHQEEHRDKVAELVLAELWSADLQSKNPHRFRGQIPLPSLHTKTVILALGRDGFASFEIDDWEEDFPGFERLLGV